MRKFTNNNNLESLGPLFYPDNNAGEYLGLVRRSAGITQEKLAKRMGTKQESIARVENGWEPGLKYFAKFVRACGVRTFVMIE